MRSVPRAGALWPLYAGGFIGPFGGSMVNTMLPELADGLNASSSAAATALTWYMVPFAGLLVVSGTLAARWGEVRTLRAAYLSFALGAVVCAVASTSDVFMAGRALQGAANAFTTPVLITLIARRQPPGRVGRGIGTYASMQAAGQAFAPLVGGIAADIGYRFAFWAIGAAALSLLALTSAPSSVDPSGPSPGPLGAHPWRSLANVRLARAAAVAFCVQFAGTGLMLMAALYCGDRFALPPPVRGLMVALFGVAGLITGSSIGRLADRIGLRAMGIATMSLLAVATASLGLVTVVWLLPITMLAAGAAATGGRILAQNLFIASTPENRGGATSLGLGGQFLGTAAAPVVVLAYDQDVLLASLAAGAVAGLGSLLMLRPRHPEPPTAGAVPLSRG